MDVGESVGRGSSPALAVVHDLEIDERVHSEAGEDRGSGAPVADSPDVSHTRAVPKEPVRSDPAPVQVSALSIEGALAKVASEPPSEPRLTGPPSLPSASTESASTEEERSTPASARLRHPSRPPPAEPNTTHAPPEAPAAESVQPDRGSEPSGARSSLDDLLTVDDGTHDFFVPSTPPAAVTFDSWVPATPMSRESRQAMMFSIGVLVVSLLGIGSYLVYHKLIMPTPVALGGASPQPMGFDSAPAAVAPPVEMAPLAEATGPGASAPPPPAPPDSVDPEPVPEPGAEPVAELAAVDDGSDGEDPASDELAQAPESPSAPEEVGAAESAAATEMAPAGRPSPADELAYRKRVDVAEALLKRHKHDEALAAFGEALSYWPAGPEALAKVAFLHLQHSRNEQARDYAQRAVASDPTDSEAWIILGAAHQALRDLAAAKQAYRTCAEQASGKFLVECRRLAR